MKYVEFYDGTTGKYEKVGGIRIVGGTFEYSGDADRIRGALESTSVRYRGKCYRPTDDDKERYLNLLPFGFCGSYFRASKVLEK